MKINDIKKANDLSTVDVTLYKEEVSVLSTLLDTLSKHEELLTADFPGKTKLDVYELHYQFVIIRDLLTYGELSELTFMLRREFEDELHNV